MLSSFARIRTHALASAVLALAACSSDSPSQPLSLAGSYVAPYIRVTPAGGSQMDVVAKGGSLTISIAADNTTSGTLSLPASVTGGAPFTASMAGTVLRTGDVVTFQQSADTFVRDLRWTVYSRMLVVDGQTVGGSTFSATLERQ